jgi:hypothetical protein
MGRTSFFTQWAFSRACPSSWVVEVLPHALSTITDTKSVSDFIRWPQIYVGGEQNIGKRVELEAFEVRRYEQWTLDEDGLILQSLGHLDDSEYPRQLNAGAKTIDAEQ